MWRELTALSLLVCFVLNLACAGRKVGLAQQAQASSEAKAGEKFKKRALELGPNTRVRVKLTSGEKVEGNIAEITPEALVVRVAKDGGFESRTIEFADIKSLEKSGSGLSRGAKVALGIAIGVGLGALIWWIILLSGEPS